MKESKDKCRKWLGILLVIFIVLIIITGTAWYRVLEFNTQPVFVDDEDADSGISISTDIDAAKGERWESDMVTADSPETPVHFKGETVNCYVANNYDYDIKEWSLKLCPGTECYINGFWGGSIEVHQFRNGEEIIETLEQIMNKDEINYLETNPYIDTMLIRIKPGDYLIFSPAGDSIITRENNTGIVFNYYYMDNLDFSDYEFTYINDLKIEETWMYSSLFCSWILWILAMLVTHTVLVVNKRLMRDMKYSMQSISVMADLYLETHMIDTEKQKVKLIKGSEDKTVICFDEKAGIQESLNRYAEEDCEDGYADELKSFFRLDTLQERMKNDESIVCEYISKSRGFFSARIFKLEGKKNTVNFIIALQDINEERKRLQDFEDRIREREDTFMIQADFLASAFSSVKDLMAGVSEDTEKLALLVNDSEHGPLAKSVSNRIGHMKVLDNCIYDLFDIETNRFTVHNEVYSMEEIRTRLLDIMLPYYTGKDFEFIIDIDPKIPDRLIGDRERIMQILVLNLFGAMMVTEKGSVKLSVFGKQNGDKEDLVFSIKDTSMGFPDELTAMIMDDFRNCRLHPVEYPAMVYLQILNYILVQMNSGMKMVSVLGEGSEFYFSLEQGVESEKVVS